MSLDLVDRTGRRPGQARRVAAPRHDRRDRQHALGRARQRVRAHRDRRRVRSDPSAARAQAQAALPGARRRLSARRSPPLGHRRPERRDGALRPDRPGAGQAPRRPGAAARHLRQRACVRHERLQRHVRRPPSERWTAAPDDARPARLVQRAGRFRSRPHSVTQPRHALRARPQRSPAPRGERRTVLPRRLLRLLRSTRRPGSRSTRPPLRAWRTASRRDSRSRVARRPSRRNSSPGPSSSQYAPGASSYAIPTLPAFATRSPAISRSNCTCVCPHTTRSASTPAKQGAMACTGVRSVKMSTSLRGVACTNSTRPSPSIVERDRLG